MRRGLVLTLAALALIPVGAGAQEGPPVAVPCAWGGPACLPVILVQAPL